MVKKLVVAAAVGTAVFLVIVAAMILFSFFMAARVQAWEEAAAGLSGFQAAGVHLARIVRVYWWLITPIVFLLSVGGSLVAAALKKGRA